MVFLVFIFLTPKSWFSSGERAQNIAHQSPVATTLLVSPQVVGSEGDTQRITEHVKALTGRDDVKVLAVRRLFDREGKTRSFEVDIQ